LIPSADKTNSKISPHLQTTQFNAKKKIFFLVPLQKKKKALIYFRLLVAFFISFLGFGFGFLSFLFLCLLFFCFLKTRFFFVRFSVGSEGRSATGEGWKRATRH